MPAVTNAARSRPTRNQVLPVQPTGDNGFMKLELLHIDQCPNSASAHKLLEEALTALDHADTEIHMRLLKSASDIEGTGFAGSPTITVNGTDIFPDGAPSTDLACRIYMTPNGFAGLPTMDQLTSALRDHGL